MIGGDSNGVPFKDWAHQQWMDKYGVKPPWGKIEFINLASALARFEQEAQARVAWDQFLACSEPFYEGHNPRKFMGSLDRWLLRAVKAMPKAPSMEAKDERIEALRRLHREIEGDSVEKRVEIARRFKEMYP